ncbi:uncharacterized protein LOC143459966 [Clavelina lepadiformis]|uniref:uncharacterized protein LOC143459966 n=1 Tax=Clavelina lepadiformis TaxID=159417 RepID=UPI00404209E7
MKLLLILLSITSLLRASLALYAPVDVTPVEVSTHSLSVRWRTVDGDAKEFYATITPLDDGESTKQTKHINQSYTTWVDLVPGKNYTISVVAQGHGGSYSQPAFATVTTVPMPPFNVRISKFVNPILNEYAVEGNKTMKFPVYGSVVLWEGPDTGYHDGFDVVVNPPHGKVKLPILLKAGARIDDPRQKRRIIWDLTPGLYYDFTVRTTSNGRKSDPATVGERMPPEIPGVLKKESVQPTEVTLSWDEPYRGILDGFVLELDPIEGTVIEPDDLTKKRRVIQDLVPGTKYNVDIYSISHGILSFESRRGEFKTPPSKPGGPVVTSDLKTTSVLLQWKRPVGRFNYYEVVYYPSLLDHDRLRHRVYDPAVKLTRLEADTEYSLIVYAVSNGIYSQPLLDKTRTALPRIATEATREPTAPITEKSAAQNPFFHISAAPPSERNPADLKLKTDPFEAGTTTTTRKPSTTERMLAANTLPAHYSIPNVAVNIEPFPTTIYYEGRVTTGLSSVPTGSSKINEVAPHATTSEIGSLMTKIGHKTPRTTVLPTASPTNFRTTSRTITPGKGATPAIGVPNFVTTPTVASVPSGVPTSTSTHSSTSTFNSPRQRGDEEKFPTPTPTTFRNTTFELIYIEHKETDPQETGDPDSVTPYMIPFRRPTTSKHDGNSGSFSEHVVAGNKSEIEQTKSEASFSTTATTPSHKADDKSSQAEPTSSTLPMTTLEKFTTDSNRSEIPTTSTEAKLYVTTPSKTPSTTSASSVVAMESGKGLTTASTAAKAPTSSTTKSTQFFIDFLTKKSTLTASHSTKPGKSTTTRTNPFFIEFITNKVTSNPVRVSSTVSPTGTATTSSSLPPYYIEFVPGRSSPSTNQEISESYPGPNDSTTTQASPHYIEFATKDVKDRLEESSTSYFSNSTSSTQKPTSISTFASNTSTPAVTNASTSQTLSPASAITDTLGNVSTEANDVETTSAETISESQPGLPGTKAATSPTETSNTLSPTKQSVPISHSSTNYAGTTDRLGPKHREDVVTQTQVLLVYKTTGLSKNTVVEEEPTTSFEKLVSPGHSAPTSVDKVTLGTVPSISTSSSIRSRPYFDSYVTPNPDRSNATTNSSEEVPAWPFAEGFVTPRSTMTPNPAGGFKEETQSHSYSEDFNPGSSNKIAASNATRSSLYSQSQSQPYFEGFYSPSTTPQQNSTAVTRNLSDFNSSDVITSRPTEFNTVSAPVNLNHTDGRPLFEGSFTLSQQNQTPHDTTEMVDFSKPTTGAIVVNATGAPVTDDQTEELPFYEGFFPFDATTSSTLSNHVTTNQPPSKEYKMTTPDQNPSKGDATTSFSASTIIGRPSRTEHPAHTTPSLTESFEFTTAGLITNTSTGTTVETTASSNESNKEETTHQRERFAWASTAALAQQDLPTAVGYVPEATTVLNGTTSTEATVKGPTLISPTKNATEPVRRGANLELKNTTTSSIELVQTTTGSTQKPPTDTERNLKVTTSVTNNFRNFTDPTRVPTTTVTPNTTTGFENSNVTTVAPTSSNVASRTTPSAIGNTVTITTFSPDNGFTTNEGSDITVQTDGRIVPIKEGFTTICKPNNITVLIDKSVIGEYETEYGPLHLNEADNPACVGIEYDTYYRYTLAPNLLECGTQIELNETHVNFTNTVSNERNRTGWLKEFTDSAEVVILGNKMSNFKMKFVNLRVWCTFPLDLNVTAEYPFLPKITTQILSFNISGHGEFSAIMQLFETDAYLQPYNAPPVLNATESLFVGISLLETQDESTFMVVKRCWGTPKRNPLHSQQYDIIKNYCPVRGSLDGTVKVYGNGLGGVVKWEGAVFKFISYERVWLHCEIKICFGEDCQPNCANRRKRRSLEDDINVHILSTGPIVMMKDPSKYMQPTTPQTTAEPKVVGAGVFDGMTALILFIVLSVVILASLITIITIYCRLRRTKLLQKKLNVESTSSRRNETRTFQISDKAGDFHDISRSSPAMHSFGKSPAEIPGASMTSQSVTCDITHLNELSTSTRGNEAYVNKAYKQSPHDATIVECDIIETLPTSTNRNAALYPVKTASSAVVSEGVGGQYLKLV